MVALATGALIALLCKKFELKDYQGRLREITMLEFILGSLAVIVIVVIVTLVVGPKLARNGAIGGFHEFRNGSVTEAKIVVTSCTEDGSCLHHYECDHEEIYHPAVTNSKGETISPAYWQSVWHECPYVRNELSYVLNTNIHRQVTIANGDFGPHPEEWRRGHGIPAGVPREPPARWLKAKADLESGMSDPVTGVFEYANFILASDSGLYKTYEGSVVRFRKAGLIIPPTAEPNNHLLYDYGMQAAKVQAAGGLQVPNLSEWNERLMRLNAALGSEFQGDMHIVLVPAYKVSNPDEYITALKAFWTSLGKWSISKNGIILAIGVSPDGKTVAWSRASTGMPVGNGEMLEALKLELAELPLNPSVLLGRVGTNVSEEGHELKVKYDLTAGGAIGNIVFIKYPFKRVCMKCTSKGDKGVGYVDLTELVPITTGAKILMFFIAFILSCVVWGALVVFDPLSTVIPSRSMPKRSVNRYRDF